MTESTGILETLERSHARIFLIGGCLLAIFAVNSALRTFVGTSFPPVQGFIGPAGFLLGVLGLLGLYPALLERTPLLARGAAGVAVIPAIGWSLIIIRGIVEHGLGLFTLPEALAAIPFVVIVSMIPTFGLFALASFHAGVHSRAVGLLLLLPATGFALLVTNAAPHIVIDTGHVVGYLGVGYILSKMATSTTSSERMAEATP